MIPTRKARLTIERTSRVTCRTGQDEVLFAGSLVINERLGSFIYSGRKRAGLASGRIVDAGPVRRFDERKVWYKEMDF
jgi:hypothetical protein